MAKRKCMDSLVQVEHRLELLNTLCVTVDDASTPNSPPWLHLVWTMVQDLEKDLQKHSAAVRGDSC